MRIDFNKYPLPRRLRHHTSPNFYLRLEELKNEPDYYPDIIKYIDWTEVFNNSEPPDALDIGCGKGIFLLNYAQKNPNKNILGIEVRVQLTQWIMSVIGGEKIPNCSAVWYSVANGLPFIEDNSIENIFYLFPDPWPKRKHQKRRAFNIDFLNEVYRVLKPDGFLHLATDVPEVNDYHIETLKKYNKLSFQVLAPNFDWGLPTTNKENFCKLNNIPYVRIICKKSL